jgi:hypothetical protein
MLTTRDYLMVTGFVVLIIAIVFGIAALNGFP